MLNPGEPFPCQHCGNMLFWVDISMLNRCRSCGNYLYDSNGVPILPADQQQYAKLSDSFERPREFSLKISNLKINRRNLKKACVKSWFAQKTWTIFRKQ